MAKQTNNNIADKLAVWGFIVLVFSGAFVYSYPPARFWNAELENNMTHCGMYAGGMNVSIWQDERTSWCWNEGWEHYCKMSYPAHCPGQNDPLAKCLESCAAYGTKDCPCGKH